MHSRGDFAVPAGEEDGILFNFYYRFRKFGCKINKYPYVMQAKISWKVL